VTPRLKPGNMVWHAIGVRCNEHHRAVLFDLRPVHRQNCSTRPTPGLSLFREKHYQTNKRAPEPGERNLTVCTEGSWTGSSSPWPALGSSSRPALIFSISTVPWRFMISVPPEPCRPHRWQRPCPFRAGFRERSLPRRLRRPRTRSDPESTPLLCGVLMSPPPAISRGSPRTRTSFLKKPLATRSRTTSLPILSSRTNPPQFLPFCAPI
jgi:hypothetical protein